MFTPQIQLDNSINCPSYSFLISHGSRHILFDLGTQPDHLTPPMQSRMKKMGFGASAEKHVAQILNEHASTTGVHSKDIEAVIWSHQHWDHTGNLDTFPGTTLVVGPGFKKAHTPAYPTNQESALWDTDFQNREFRELDIAGTGLKIGNCHAFDFFGDGSFYLLDTPGHTVGHICGLARVSSSPDSFVLMGGDACHNAGEMRPTEYLPLPKTVKPSPIDKYAVHGCPGEILQRIHPKHSANEPFYTPAESFNADNDEAKRSITKLIELDASQHVLIILAHDAALYDELPFFPKTINDWYTRGFDEKTRWNFTRAMGPAIEKQEAV